MISDLKIISGDYNLLTTYVGDQGFAIGSAIPVYFTLFGAYVSRAAGLHWMP